MKVQLSITSILIFSMVTLAFSACIQKPTADEIIGKMQQKYESIENYKAEIHQIEEANGKTEEADFTVYFKKPDKFRTDCPSRERVAVLNGSTFWVFDMQRNQVKITQFNTQLDNASGFDLLGFILKEMEKYRINLTGRENVNGEECYVLNLKLKNEEPSQVKKIWVAEGEWYPVRIEFRIKPSEGFQKVFPNLSVPEESTVILEFRDMEMNGKIGDELFAIPRNANVSMIVEMPDGERLIAEVQENLSKFTIKTTDGKIIGSEDWQRNLTSKGLRRERMS